MTRRELVGRVAIWLLTGFLLTLLVGIIASLVTHHSGQTQAQVAGAIYVGLSVIVLLLRLRTRTHSPAG